MTKHTESQSEDLEIVAHYIALADTIVPLTPEDQAAWERVYGRLRHTDQESKAQGNMERLQSPTDQIRAMVGDRIHIYEHRDLPAYEATDKKSKDEDPFNAASVVAILQKRASYYQSKIYNKRKQPYLWGRHLEAKENAALVEALLSHTDTHSKDPE
jgi:hypothetical protein